MRTSRTSGQGRMGMFVFIPISALSLFAFGILLLASCRGGKSVIGPGPGIAGTPVAKAAADPLIGDSPVTVTLSAAGSYDPDGHIVRWQWDFENDGTCDWSSTTSGTTTHEYPAGEHTAKLLVTDDSGKSATATIENVFSNPAHLYWTFEKVDGGPDAGYGAGAGSINIDPRDGRPCIVYKVDLQEGEQVKVAWRNTDGTYEFDEFNFGHRFGYSNAVIRADGTIVVALYWDDDSIHQSQLSAVWRSPEGVWTTEIIDDEGRDIGNYVRLALDEQNNPGVVYQYGATDNRSAANQVRYAHFDGSQWNVEPTDIDVLSYTDLTDGLVYVGATPYILIADEVLVLFKRQEAGIWQETVLDETAPSYFAAAAGVYFGGKIQIVAGMDPSNNQAYWYKGLDGVWERQLVFDGADVHHWFPGFPSIVVDAARTYVAFAFIDQPYIMYFCYSDGSDWRQEPALVGKDVAGALHALALEADGSILLVYYDVQQHELWLGRRVPVS